MRKPMPTTLQTGVALDPRTCTGLSATMLYGVSWIYFIDLEREKEIEVGTSWPYPDLKLGECVLSVDY